MLCLASCGLHERAARNLDRLSQQQLEDYHQSIANAPDGNHATPITWTNARERMLRYNLALKQSEMQREDAAKMTARQWQSLIPRMAAFLNLGESLSEISNLNSDSLNASLFANLNIPNPVAFHAALYAAALQKIGAEWQHEINLRRAHIDLLGAFSHQRFLDEYAASLARKERLELPSVTGDPGNAINTIMSERRSLERMRTSHRLRLNSLLNTPGANWKLAGPSPGVDYSRRIDQISISGDFGKMALKMQALQIELAQLRVSGVRVRQWPNVSFGLGLPPLYTSQQGTSGFNADNMLIFSSVGKSIDFTDPLGLEDIQNAEKRFTLTVQTLRLRMEEESVRLRQVAADYSRQQREIRILQRRLAHIESSPATESVVLLAALNERESLVRAINDMKRQLELIEHQLLLWDERHWK